jgi:hypothetical protein
LIRVLFASDIHGSERCFRKFLNAVQVYKAQALILGGDITGKALVPIVGKPDGSFECTLAGRTLTAKSAELEELKRQIRDAAGYAYKCDESELSELQNNPDRLKQVFTTLMVESIRSWVDLASERMTKNNAVCYISPGNDDVFEIDEVLVDAEGVVNPEGRVVRIDSHEMITLGYTNETPWKSPRESSESGLEARIVELAEGASNIRNCIFNLHCPPYDTPIDQAPKLDAKLRPIVAGNEAIMVPVGSKAVRACIERYQPLAGFHGHVHESFGFVKIGRTLCFNPGTEYGQGILRGLLCDLDRGKIRSYLFTTG